MASWPVDSVRLLACLRPTHRIRWEIVCCCSNDNVAAKQRPAARRGQYNAQRQIQSLVPPLLVRQLLRRHVLIIRSLLGHSHATHSYEFWGVTTSHRSEHRKTNLSWRSVSYSWLLLLSQSSQQHFCTSVLQARLYEFHFHSKDRKFHKRGRLWLDKIFSFLFPILHIVCEYWFARVHPQYSFSVNSILGISHVPGKLFNWV